MPRQREALALLTIAAALGGAGAAAAKSRPTGCAPPRTGSTACEQVLYEHAADGTAQRVRVTAVLLLRLDRCPAHPGRRTVTLTRSGQDALGTARRPATCRKGLLRWRARFGTGKTKDWNLKPGDSVDGSWTGSTAQTSVRIEAP